MPCYTTPLPGGGYAIVKVANKRARPCSVCGQKIRDAKLCDFKLGGGPQTCDAVLCARCAHHVPPDTDYCPLHAYASKESGC